MNIKNEINPTKFNLPISSIQDIVTAQTRMLNSLKDSWDKYRIPFVTSGILDFNFVDTNTSYSKFYCVPLKDPNESVNVIYLDIPKVLITKYRISGGESVRVMGYLQVNVYNNQISIRFAVMGLDLDTSNQLLARSNKSFSEFFKNLQIERIPFPIFQKLDIAIITPIGGDAFFDLTKEIKVDKSHFEITQYATNIISKECLMESLNNIALQNKFNVLIIARGGGAANEFNIFDDIDICEKFANIKCHKMLGLGHTNNRTLLDMLADNIFQTPTAVGSYINTTLNKLALTKDSFRNLCIIKAILMI